MKTNEDWLDIWNTMHCNYIKQGVDFRNKVMTEWLVETLTEAKEAYYNTGETIMEDSMYDRFEEYLKVLDPNNDFLEKVGV